MSVTYPPLSDFISFPAGTWNGLHRKPTGYDSAKKYAAIFFLHGIGESDDGTNIGAQISAGGNAHGATALVSKENETLEPVFFFAPQCKKGQSWYGTAGIAALKSMLALAKTTYKDSIDWTRVVLTGLSWGGMGAEEVVRLIPNTFSCHVALSGSVLSAPLIPDIPVAVAHGDKDTTVDPASDNSSVQQWRAAGRVVIYTHYPSATHDIWEDYYAQDWVPVWMKAQKLGTTSAQMVLPSWAPASTSISRPGLGGSNTTINLPKPAPIPVPLPAPVTTSTPALSMTTQQDLAVSTPIVSFTSSVEAVALGGDNAFDGNPDTRWGSGWSDNQWLTRDLGANYPVGQVDLDWYSVNSYGKSYRLDVSLDNVNWQTVMATGAKGAGIISHIFPTPVIARYVRMYGLTRSANYGFSLKAFSVYMPKPTDIAALVLALQQAMVTST